MLVRVTSAQNTKICILHSARRNYARPGLPNLWHAVRFPWHAAFTAVSVFLFVFLPDQCLYMCINTHIRLPRDCTWVAVATKWYCSLNIFTQIGSGAKCWLDIDHWGAGLAVTWRIRDVGQNGLQSSFQTGNSSSSSSIYFHIFFLIAFLEEPFVRNVIIQYNHNLH